MDATIEGAHTTKPNLLKRLTEHSPTLNPEQAKAKSVRQIGETFANLSIYGNVAELSKGLYHVLERYVGGGHESQTLAQDFHDGGLFAQELYRHGARARLALAKFADSDGTITLIRGNSDLESAEQIRKGATWPHTVKSYTSNPHVAESFDSGRHFPHNQGREDTHLDLPDNSRVAVSRIPIEDIVDVMGFGSEEEFLVLDKTLIPPDSLKKITRAGRSKFFRKPSPPKQKPSNQ